MKVYTFFTETHKVFLNTFINSFPFQDGLDLEIKYLPQECKSGKYESEGWNLTMKKKLEYILYSLEETKDNEYFVHSDIDIQFFGDIKTDLENIVSSSDSDIFFQNDGIYACMGFFICRKNEKTIKFFNEVLNQLPNFPNDQVSANHVLKQNIVKMSILPNRYYTVGVRHGSWFGNKVDFIIPNDIIMHHANYTEGIQNKIKLLEIIKNKVNERVSATVN